MSSERLTALLRTNGFPVPKRSGPAPRRRLERAFAGMMESHYLAGEDLATESGEHLHVQPPLLREKVLLILHITGI